MLASGSDDKTCRIWDIRTGKVHKALTGFESSVTATAFTPTDAHTIYVVSGDKIITFDLRMESLILKTSQSTNVYAGAKDEINQIQVNHLATYLAACDDSGDVRILNLKSHKWMGPFERKHENIAMSARFVPKKELQVISGGMDKLIIAWDFYKGRATQFISSVHPCGTRVAVGLGDGAIQFLHTPSDPPSAPTTSTSGGDCTTATKTPAPSKKSNKKGAAKQNESWVIGGRLYEAHMSPIATIEYTGFDPNWLVTSSSNGSIAIWEDQAARYESFKRHQEEEEWMERTRNMPIQRTLPYNRPLQPLQEFRTTDVFERVNCISTSRSSVLDGDNDNGNKNNRLLFVAGTHPKVDDKKLQGRIAVYQL
ncbi:WD repeat-containing protein 53 [Modicella reniformis]|uniref:WD repeat-containing protein 53 n=1 Tax=Modicella reniformis TaxID=1440133 RepID=A0A9P6IM42_9FUNG|nr:WD repeat-containing protein 53 [Modicella reniformis]